MRHLLAVVLYTALGLGANAGAAADIAGLREGSMLKLAVHEAPVEVPATSFTDAEGAEHGFADWKGKVVLVNFWATWCAPCRKELPALDALNRDLGGDDFAVVTIATGRNPQPAITRLFDEVGVKTLPVYLDPKLQLSREMGVLGLPVSILLNREGQEVARMSGDAEWDSDSARAIVAALVAEKG
ncbi:MAG TPA: TlpA disulfide reductase family protein [Albidovulum sp.]|uniref:TlpA family protein disulfide reductase n=1 Tax=Albidovulum sp. TaxID=1872424 RepID=UPI002BBDB8BE|nr:TlpA disulfide reductase family protein [Albidovulum sp.]